MRIQKYLIGIISGVFFMGAFCLGGAHANEISGSISKPADKIFGMEEVSRRVLSHQAEIRLSFQKLQEAEEKLRKSKAEFFPKLSTNASGAFATGDKRFVTYFDAGITQPIFAGGKFLAIKHKEETQVEAEKMNLQEVNLLVELKARELYVEILREQGLKDILSDEVRELSEDYSKIKTLVKQKVLIPQQILHRRSLLRKAKYELVQHEENYKFLTSLLSGLMKIGPEEVLKLQRLPDLPEVSQPLSFYLKLSRMFSPLYQRGKFEIQGKQFEKKELEAEKFPKLNLMTKWNWFQDVYVDTNRMLAGVSGSWDIWDFGRLKHEIEAKDHEISEMKLMQEITIRNHENEIRRLFHDIRAGREKIRLEDTLLEERREIYKSKKTQMIAGEKGAQELLDYYLAFQDSRISRLSAVSEYWILFLRLGGKTNFDILSPFSVTVSKPEVQ